MTTVLVLGGTGWLGGEIARRWVALGAEVTVTGRGGRPAPPGARRVVVDRSNSETLASLDGEWDEVVDVSSDPDAVTSALAVLAPRATHWSFISTISVYARADRPGADEDAELLDPEHVGDADDYGRGKVAAERAVLRHAGDRAAIVRPGLLVGPGDRSDRFGYWVSRAALAGADPMLAPETDGRHAQVIDVADVADLVVALGGRRWTGVVDAIGETVPLADVLDLARTIGGHTGNLVAAPDPWLLDHGVRHWMGDRSLPLWLPREMTGFATRSPARYRAEGGSWRPLEDTMRDTLADERARGLDRARVSGLSRVDELDLLAGLSA